MKNKKKNRFSKVIVALTMCFSIGGLGLGLALGNQYQKASAASYDDEEYSITLSADELNSYSWTNLLHSLEEAEETFNNLVDEVEYNDTTLVSEGGLIEPYYFAYQYVDGDDNYYQIDFNQHTADKFSFQDLDSLNYINFESDLTIYGQSFYENFKSAIELDIQANAPSSDDMGSVLTDFINILVGGIVSMASGIATGVSSMAKSLFLEVDSLGAVTGLSVFGGIVAIFAGLALAIAITTKVYTWITSLGN